MTGDKTHVAEGGARIIAEGPGVARIHPFRAFPVGALPEPIGGFVVLSAQSLHCDTAFVALPLLASLASAIGNARRVEVKPDWHEPSVLWTALIGKSGTGKSPALQKATVFAHEQDRKAHAEAETRREQHEKEQQIYERDYSRWKGDRKNGDASPPKRPSHPPEARSVVNETTVEALAAISAESPRGLLLIRDELSGWFGSFGQYKSGGSQADEAQWLEMHGAGIVRVDRKGKGASVFVPRASVSITGGIQPAVLAKCLTPGRYASGLAARFLFAMPPDRPQLWSDVSVEQEVVDAVQDVFQQLYMLTGAADSTEDGLTPIDIPLSDDARTRFIAFHDARRLEQAELDDSLRAAWSKLIAVAPRIALLIRCVEDAVSPSRPLDHPIEDPTMAAAIEITEWFLYETRRIYAFLGEDEEQRRLRRLLEHTQVKGGSTSVRDAQRALRSVFATADDVRASFKQLAAMGLGDWVDHKSGPQGGRPSEQFMLCDRDRTDKTSSDGSSVTSVTTESGVEGTDDA